MVSKKRSSGDEKREKVKMKRVNVFFSVLISNEMTQEKLESLLLQAVERVGKIVVMKVEAVEELHLLDGKGGCK